MIGLYGSANYVFGLLAASSVVIVGMYICLERDIHLAARRVFVSILQPYCV
jgi:hypothetical protein